MTKDEAQKRPQQPDYNVPGTWTKVSLIVTRADVFQGVLRPPGEASHGGNGGVPDADFDAVLLIETTTVAAAAKLARTSDSSPWCGNSVRPR